MADDLLETPLFPLNVVLVPGMALPLHIFEPRYRRMTCDCLDSEMQVGVVLGLPGGESGNALPARVGTLARIVDYERLPDGRYNLLALGTQRFEIVELRHDHPYLSALVRLLPDREEPGDLESLALEARAALTEYLRLVLEQVGGNEGEIGIPSEPCDLSYIMVMCLACDDAEKQRMLEMTSVAGRLRTGIQLLRTETEMLAAQAEHLPQHPGDNSRASLN
ncbi:MAG: LON peptidase substrate-binding domain-containing protein [Ktedonobacterales bacterium]|nr:LON peptidase substrate-binding domain-containing protein [Ktedonobacterales bacterium]